MITSIEIYLNNEWLSIENSIESFSQYQNRADEAFAIGNFKAWLNINKNIPPYTPLLIKRDDGSIEYFMSKSKANRYLTENGLWVHDITITDPTSVLACFIVGSKNFGVTGNYKNDSFKIVILKQLMEYKYPIFLNFPDSYVLGMQQEFTYGPGTTLYDVLVDIAKTYNRLPKVTSYSLDADTGKWLYTVEFIDLSGGSEYVLDSKNIMSVSYDQDSDTYCNRLEAEVANVIDRTYVMTVEGLTFRSNEIKLIEDNAFLKLPTKIEKIVEVRANISFLKNYIIRNIPISYYDGSTTVDWAGEGNAKTLFEWVTLISNSGQFSLLNVIYGFEESTKFPIDYNALYYADVYTDVFHLVILDNSNVQTFSIPIDNFVLPRSQYESLPADEQPYHVYYQTGGQTIEGFNQTYKDDLWNNLIGEGEAPTLLEIVLETDSVANYPRSYTLDGVTMVNNVSPIFYGNFIEAMFDIDYIPVVDMFMSSKKKILPNNESSYKDYSRTYNIGANFIDFDRANDSIQRTNDSSGNSELAIEYHTATPPHATQYITYEGVKWYVASVVRNINLTNEYCTINLVSDYNKVAEAIGVKTQYSETKNPLENIIDRYIFVESDTEISIRPSKTYINVQMKYNLFKKATVMHHNGIVYLVCEAEDQYSFGVRAEFNSTKYCKNTQIPYANEYNEMDSAYISVVDIDSLTFGQSFSLPIYTGDRTVKIGFGAVPIYKDARERLIFTIKLNNATIINN